MNTKEETLKGRRPRVFQFPNKPFTTRTLQTKKANGKLPPLKQAGLWTRLNRLVQEGVLVNLGTKPRKTRGRPEVLFATPNVARTYYIAQGMKAEAAAIPKDDFYHD